MLATHGLVLGFGALPWLVTVVWLVSDEIWDRASVKDDAVKLGVLLNFGAAGRGKLSYEMPEPGEWRRASRMSSGVPSMVWAGRVRS